MNGYTPEVGHRVEVTTVWRGVIESWGEPTFLFRADDGTLIRGSHEGFTTREWKRLPDPEPCWQVGDVVLDADGDVFHRGTDADFPWVKPRTTPKEYGDREFRHANRFAEQNPVRPLTPLVRDGKPWPTDGAQ